MTIKNVVLVRLIFGLGSHLINKSSNSPDTASVIVLQRPIMEAAGSKIASEAARGGGQEENKLMNEEDDGHDDPLGRQVEDVPDAGQNLVVVGPRLSRREGVADQEDNEVADGEPLKDAGHPEP